MLKKKNTSERQSNINLNRLKEKQTHDKKYTDNIPLNKK